jgi:pectate lyase
VVTVGTVALTQFAFAATAFSANFEDGSLSAWSKSGGDWSVVSDGSQVAQQGKIDSALAREFAGDSTWTSYSVQARVKPTAFNGSGSFAGLAAHASGSTTFDRVVLLNTGQAQLQAVNSGSVTVLGTASVGVSAGTWYTVTLTESGSSVSGSVNGTQIGSGASVGSTGRIGMQTNLATGHFDDVVVTTGGTPPPTTPPTTATSRPPTTAPPTTQPPTTQPPTTNPPPTTGLIGWATQGGGTTGGAGGSTTTVTSASALISAVAASGPAIIRVSGNFSCSADIKVASNKTILGVGSGSGLTGCGLDMKGVNNVIIRNMKIAKVPASEGTGDAIHIESSTHLWIDHNDLSSDTSHGTDFYDGLLDITHAGDYITVSWNVIHDHIKCSLVGHSDSNASEDTGHLRVTYHHNEFSNCAERNPRVRFGNPVHVFNNYYVNTQTFSYSYAIASTENAGVLVEGNYFENITDPIHLGEGSSSAGSVVARNNFEVNSGPILTSGSVASIPYSYTVDSPSTVKATVLAGAGTGKIST